MLGRVFSRFTTSIKRHPIGWALIVLAGILCITQAERFIHKGSILGYQVRHLRQAEIQAALRESSNKPSEACKKVTDKEVAAVLGVEVQRTGGGVADRHKPAFVSGCTYRTLKSPNRLTTIYLRDSQNEEAAKQSMELTSRRTGAEAVAKLGDQAIYIPTTRQLYVRDGQRITTITVGPSTEASKISSKEVATKLAAQAL